MTDTPLNRRTFFKGSAAGVFALTIPSQVAHADSETISSGQEISGQINTEDETDEYELAVNQGDVVEVTFEKESREQLSFRAQPPRHGLHLIDLGGSDSEGETDYRDRVTIEETGTLDISVITSDSELDSAQSYSFQVTRYEGLDQWPANDPAEIESGEEITGTVHSADDEDTFDLLVDQGDVIDVEFEKESRDQTRLRAQPPRHGLNLIDLGGSDSEGETEYRDRVTIEETGTLEITVETEDDDDPTDPDEVVEDQPYSFEATRYDGLDQWPANDPAEIESGEEITGTVHSADDEDTFEFLVDQGDVVNVEFETPYRTQTRLRAQPPRHGLNSIDLGGTDSEGTTHFDDSVSIEETGTLDITVETEDDDDPTDPNEVVDGQDWTFIINGELDRDEDESDEEEPGPAEFEVSDTIVNPDSIEAEDDVSVEVATDVTNVGEEIEDVEVELLIDSDWTDSIVTEALDTEETETVSFDFDPPERSGDYTVTVETPDDTDNATLTVSEAVEPAEFNVEDTTVSPDSVEAGEDTTVEVATTVTNTGDAADDVELRLLVEGEEVESEVIELSGGRTTDYDANIDAPEHPGEYEITAEADAHSDTTALTAEEVDEDDSTESETEDDSTEGETEDDSTEGEAEDDTTDAVEEAADDIDDSEEGTADDTADDDMPGFGISSTVASIGGVVYLLNNRLNGTDGETE